MPVEYARSSKTPDGLAKVEVRMMFLRLFGQPVLVNSLMRITKGKMLGVDFNKDQIGSGRASRGDLHPQIRTGLAGDGKQVTFFNVLASN